MHEKCQPAKGDWPRGLDYLSIPFYALKALFTRDIFAHNIAIKR
jgi:hypothetical protein